MRFRTPLAFVFFILIFSLFSGCIFFDSSAPIVEKKPTCRDGIQNGKEEGVDCGGVCKACNEPHPKSCSNGVADVDETDIDCGRECDSCLNGRLCKTDSDCRYGVCKEFQGDARCYPTSCEGYFDEIQAAQGTVEVGPQLIAFPKEKKVLRVYCDSEGYTLLLSAKKDSENWAYDGEYWNTNKIIPGEDDDRFGEKEIMSSNLEQDRRTPAYKFLPIKELKLCYGNPNKSNCYVFESPELSSNSRTLASFFNNNESIVIEQNMAVFNAGFSTIEANTYLKALGFHFENLDNKQSPPQCFWIGINYSPTGPYQSSGSKLGLLGDFKNGCDRGANKGDFDDMGLGVGLRLPQDDINPRFPTEAGISRFVSTNMWLAPEVKGGARIEFVGPWFVFGK